MAYLTYARPRYSHFKNLAWKLAAAAALPTAWGFGNAAKKYFGSQWRRITQRRGRRKNSSWRPRGTAGAVRSRTKARGSYFDRSRFARRVRRIISQYSKETHADDDDTSMTVTVAVPEDVIYPFDAIAQGDEYNMMHGNRILAHGYKFAITLHGAAISAEHDDAVPVQYRIICGRTKDGDDVNLADWSNTFNEFDVQLASATGERSNYIIDSCDYVTVKPQPNCIVEATSAEATNLGGVPRVVPGVKVFKKYVKLYKNIKYDTTTNDPTYNRPFIAVLLNPAPCTEFAATAISNSGSHAVNLRRYWSE